MEYPAIVYITICVLIYIGLKTLSYIKAEYGGSFARRLKPKSKK